MASSGNIMEWFRNKIAANTPAIAPNRSGTARKRTRTRQTVSPTRRTHSQRPMAKQFVSWSAAGSAAPRRFGAGETAPNVWKLSVRTKAVSRLPPCHRSPWPVGACGGFFVTADFLITTKDTKSFIR